MHVLGTIVAPEIAARAATIRTFTGLIQGESLPLIIALGHGASTEQVEADLQST